MCGRFTQQAIQDPSIDASWKRVHEFLSMLHPRFNLAPSQAAGVLRVGEDGPEGAYLRWGLLPWWAKDRRLAFQTINARAETVATKPAFRDAYRHRRAVVPMSGYYEWTQSAPKVKQPWYIHRPDGAPLWAAGLWEPRHPLQAEDDAGSFTVVTTAARDTAGQVHDRMPVFLTDAGIAAWLLGGVEAADALLADACVPPIAIHPVSRRVNGPQADDPALIEPIVLE